MKKLLVKKIFLLIVLVAVVFFGNVYRLRWHMLYIFACEGILLLVFTIQLFKKQYRIQNVLANLSSMILLYFFCTLLFSSINWTHSLFSLLEVHMVNSMQTNYKSYSWETSEPETFGIEKETIDEIFKELENSGSIKCLLVIKNNKLIAEEYNNGANTKTAFNIMSVTKSIISALVGIAIKENLIKNTQQKLSDFYPEYYTNNEGNKTASITIEQILKMQGGFEFQNEMKIYKGFNWIRNTINSNLINEPGEVFCYSGCQVNLLTGMIEKTTGMSVENYANKLLFEPLGIHLAYWSKTPTGTNHGAYGIFMTARDMARFGQLYLNNGVINNQQIIPKEWIDQTFKNYADEVERCEQSYSIPLDGYGYLWWNQKFNETMAYMAVGYGGQFIIVVPDKNMVLVSCADRSISWDQSAENVKIVFSWVEKLIN